MRINLVTQFAEKEKAKSLGARWDAARKQWYIVDVADLTPFMRWIPDLQAAMNAAEGASAGTGAGRTANTSAPGRTVGGARPVITRSTVKRLVCACAVLPWEDCSHTQP